MFGWIHESVKELISRKYGKETWRKILGVANLEEYNDTGINYCYKDEETYRLASAVASVLGLTVNQVWEAYGQFLVEFTMETGWDELLAAMGDDLKSFLDNLDALHFFIENVAYKFKLKGPSFRCDESSDGILTLHYYSLRSGLYPIVLGVVREIAKRIFKIEITIKVIAHKREQLERKNSQGQMCDHVVFQIRELNKSKRVDKLPPITTTANPIPTAFALTANDFVSIFPYHICFNEKLIIQHCGSYIINTHYGYQPNRTSLMDVAEAIHPEMPMDFANFVRYINSTFVFSLKRSHTSYTNESNVCLKGQMILLENGSHIIYICSPYVTTTKELEDKKLHLSDIPFYDATRDLILLNQSAMAQKKLNDQLENTTKELKKLTLELGNETDKSNSLLNELLPRSIAEQLRRGEQVVTKEFAEATVMFSDIVSFTTICSYCKPIEVVQLLNDLYSKFDRLTMLHDVYKVVTIGDGYMVVGGVPDTCDNHAERICNLAIGMLWECRTVLSPKDEPLKVRIGIHSGPVISSVVGTTQPRYSIFGETVGFANKVESTGLPLKIQVSSTTYKAASSCENFLFEERRGQVLINGKKELTYFLIKNKKRSLWELTDKQRDSNQSMDGYMELHQTSPARMLNDVELISNIENNNHIHRTNMFSNCFRPPQSAISNINHQYNDKLEFIIKYRDKNYNVCSSNTCNIM